MNKAKHGELTYEKAIEILRYCAEKGVLERKLKFGRWKVCGNKPNVLGYGYVYIDGTIYLTHHLIWLLVYGSWPENKIDHINKDKLDNRLENLRDATRPENMHNHRWLFQ